MNMFAQQRYDNYTAVALFLYPCNLVLSQSVVRQHIVLSVLYIHAFSRLFYVDLIMKAKKHPSMNETNRNDVPFRHKKYTKPR